MEGRRARAGADQRRGPLSPAEGVRRSRPARSRPGRERGCRPGFPCAPLGGRQPDAAPQGPRRPGRAHRSIFAWGLRRGGDSGREEERAVIRGVPGACPGPRGQPRICPSTLNIRHCTNYCTAPCLVSYT
ncbi:Wilms tumor protein 1-interacting protein-like [Pteropus medius]|uniref:Wilms tumor protein 1-interacting protein-like n=1 Tax=Pteropus vampyrus TaxID=132908 RepID=UPI00196A2FD3|nr:Wilms tumor protein 1-interacting protein-like [Pteropus giganteus]